MVDKVIRPQRGRTVFSAHQLNELENVFVIDQYISGQQRRRLSAQLGLTETQVRVWFQNRRIKWRKNKMERKIRLSSNWCVDQWLPGKLSSTMCKQLHRLERKISLKRNITWPSIAISEFKQPPRQRGRKPYWNNFPIFHLHCSMTKVYPKRNMKNSMGFAHRMLMLWVLFQCM